MILYIIVGLVFIALFLRKRSLESFTADASQAKFAKDVVAFIKADTTYSDFLDFLVEQKNKSYKLLRQATFYELRFLKRANNLTPNSVLQYMDN